MPAPMIIEMIQLSRLKIQLTMFWRVKMPPQSSTLTPESVNCTSGSHATALPIA